jgi:hypothetical protein
VLKASFTVFSLGAGDREANGVHRPQCPCGRLNMDQTRQITRCLLVDGSICVQQNLKLHPAMDRKPCIPKYPCIPMICPNMATITTIFWRSLISLVRSRDAGVPYHFCHLVEDEDRHDMHDRRGSFVSDENVRLWPEMPGNRV